MKILSSLQARFLLTVFMLLFLLVGSTLLMIEKREVEAIFEEQIGKGVLIAKYIKQLNIDSFVWDDKKGVSDNIEKQIDLHLIYIIFFDRDNNHFASTRFIKDFKDIYTTGSLPANVTPQSYHAEKRQLNVKETQQALHILEVEVPIFYEGSSSRWGSIKVGLSMEETLKEIQETRKGLLLIGLGGLLLGLFGATVMARHITRPLKKLVEGTVKISRGDFSQTIDIQSHDEIGELSRSFNEMSRHLRRSRKQAEEAHRKLIQAEKLASIGRMAAGIAHEIRNPLTSIKFNIQKVFANEGLGDDEISQLEISQEGIKQIEIFIKELLDFTRVSEMNMDQFSMEMILDESIKMVLDALELKKIRVIRNYEKDLPTVKADGNKLRQVFVNLLQNAHDAVKEGGLIEVGIFHLQRRSCHTVKVEIADNGCGIPEKQWNTVFESYYTTKSSGFGLGLANARKIVELHKGTIRVKKKSGDGTLFEVVIPCEEEK